MAINVLFEDLIQEVVRRVGQVAGISVQTYSEGLIGDMIQHKFDVMFEDVWWSQFVNYFTGTLDATLGVVTVDVSTLTKPLKRFEDIHTIFLPNSDTALTRFPDFINPDNVVGTTPRHVEAVDDATKVFRVLPILSTGDINVRYRSLPDQFQVGDTVNFDSQLLVLGAAYDMLEDDGTNPGASDKMIKMFEARARQLKKSRAWLPHSLDPRVHDTVDDWFTA